MKKLFLILCIFLGNICFSAEVKILHTSDIHGRISPVEYNGLKDQGGFSRRVSFVNEVRKNNKNVLLLDSGDHFQGSLYYRIDKGKANAKLLPYINYDAIVLGNHEFDNGLSVLKRNVRYSKTQFLSANVHFKDAYLQKNIKPYIVKEFDGEKFLIIGVTTTKLKNLSTADNVVITDPAEEIKKIINEVKYDKLIILSHCGMDEDKIIAKEIPQIDLILGGHNHYYFKTPRYINNTPVIQDGEFGIRVGIIDFDEKITNYSYQNINPLITSDTLIDKKIAKIDKHNQRVKNQILAKTDITLIGDQNILEHNQTNLGKLVLLSMIKPFKDNYDGVITNSGSIRINRNLSGNITYADVLEILPFDNDVVFVEISGKDLKKVFECGKHTKRRYLQYSLKDNNIDDDKMYKIITNSYIASGKDGYDEFLNSRIIKHSKIKPTVLLKRTLKDLKVLNNQNLSF